MQPATATEDLQTNSISESPSGSAIHTPADGGKLIVLTAPLTETIDHAGYFIQMALASLPSGWSLF